MASFEDIALRVAGQRKLESQSALNQLTQNKKQTNELIDMEIAKLKIALNDSKSLEDSIKLEQKQRKLDAQLQTKINAAGPGVATVGNQAIPPGEPGLSVEPEAAGLPILDQLA